MTILIITVDLQCCKCKATIEKVLDCLTEEYCIEKVEYEKMKNKVVVHGKFDAEKLCCKVRCKAGKCIKDCKPKPEESKPKKPDHCCKPEPDHCCKPEPDHCCKPKPKPEEKPKTPPKPEYKLVPYPYPIPYSMACPSWPWQCPPQQQCHSCSPPPPPPPPCKCSQQAPPQSTKPCEGACKPPTPPCSCSNHGSCGCGGTPPGWALPPPMVWAPPPPWGECQLVTQESTCSIM